MKKYLLLVILIFITPVCFGEPTDENSERVLNSIREKETNAIKVLAYEHHEIHNGDHYFIISNDTIGSGEQIVFGVTTPNTTKWIHLVFDVSSTQVTRTMLGEGAVFTGGTAIVPPNSDRNSSNTSGATIVRTPTITNEGTRLEGVKWGVAGAANRQPIGGSLNRENEIILKQNTSYLFKISSDTAGNVISYGASWYEHQNK